VQKVPVPEVVAEDMEPENEGVRELQQPLGACMAVDL